MLCELADVIGLLTGNTPLLAFDCLTFAKAYTIPERKPIAIAYVSLELFPLALLRIETYSNTGQCNCRIEEYQSGQRNWKLVKRTNHAVGR